MTENEEKLLVSLSKHNSSYYGYELSKDEIWMILQLFEQVKQLEAYQAIGTLEECRVAVERTQPKKPLQGEPFYWIDIVTVHKRNRNVRKKAYHNICPNCKRNVTIAQNWCDRCGQAIDWSKKGGAE